MWPAVLIGWLSRQEREALAYLIEENRVLRAQLGGRRLRFTDEVHDRLGLSSRADSRFHSACGRSIYAADRADTDHGRCGDLSRADLRPDTKWSGPVREWLCEAGIRIVRRADDL